MMQDDSLFHPWECKGLDPFRDDPVASDSEFGYDIEEAKSDDLEVSDMEAPCTCGNCVHMPSSEERLCCKQLLGWQREYNSGGVKDLDNSCHAIKLLLTLVFLPSRDPPVDCILGLKNFQNTFNKAIKDGGISPWTL